MDKLLTYYKQKTAEKPENKAFEISNFVTFINDPITDKDFDKVIEFIRLHMGYTSMYLSAEFLTDAGLRSIPISKILYFEFFNRKIRIKTENNEYFCDDTLRNIISLFNSHGFYQVHKGFIVNIARITSIKNYTITLSDGSIIPLAQKKSNTFRKIYKSYQEQHNAKIVKRQK